MNFKNTLTCQSLSTDRAATRPLPHPLAHDSHSTQNVCRTVLEVKSLCNTWTVIHLLLLLTGPYLNMRSFRNCCNLFLTSTFSQPTPTFAQASDTISVSSGTVGSVQVSKSPRQHLPSGPQALIKWAGEHGYGPVTSYTSTPVANHFSIGLREPGELKEPPVKLMSNQPQQREKKLI